MHRATIIGTGLCARALGPALAGVGVSVVCVAGRDAKRTEQLAKALGAEPRPISRADLEVDIILVCVPDSAISEVVDLMCEDRRFSSKGIVVHLAGSLGVNALFPASQAGLRIGKLHPIASLSGGSQRLVGVVWGIEGDEDVSQALSALVERLGGTPIDLKHVDLATYHLSAVFASNYVLAVCEAASELWRLSGAPIQASEALLPLVEGTIANWRELGIVNALTGPISRGDGMAVARQLQVVAGRAPEIETLYRSLALQVVRILQERWDPTDERLRHIAGLMNETTMVD